MNNHLVQLLRFNIQHRWKDALISNKGEKRKNCSVWWLSTLYLFLWPTAMRFKYRRGEQKIEGFLTHFEFSLKFGCPNNVNRNLTFFVILRLGFFLFFSIILLNVLSIIFYFLEKKNSLTRLKTGSLYKVFQFWG